ncbi:hypothetical protein [Devosia pacifica]|nr:hypothetical protein [Devosia pacifica]
MQTLDLHLTKAAQARLSQGEFVVWRSADFHVAEPRGRGRRQNTNFENTTEDAIAGQTYVIDRLINGALLASGFGVLQANREDVSLLVLKSRLDKLSRLRPQRGAPPENATLAMYRKFRHDRAPGVVRRLFDEAVRTAGTDAGRQIETDGREIADRLASRHVNLADLAGRHRTSEEVDSNEFIARELAADERIASELNTFDMLLELYVAARVFSDNGPPAGPDEVWSADRKADRQDVLTGELFEPGNGLPSVYLMTRIAFDFDLNPSEFLPQLYDLKPHFEAARLIGAARRTGRVRYRSSEAYWGLDGLSHPDRDASVSGDLAEARVFLRQKATKACWRLLKATPPGQLSDEDVWCHCGRQTEGINLTSFKIGRDAEQFAPADH